MNRREFLRKSLATSAAGLITSGASLQAAVSRASSGARPWNILLVMCDGLSPSAHSVFNASPVPTPHLERLGRRGTWFTRAYCDAPGCCPSRTALLTGVHAARSGVYYNSQAFRRANSWIAQANTLPQQFRQHGYLTAGYGFIAHHSGQDEASTYSPGLYKIFNRPSDVSWTESALLRQVMPASFTPSWSRAWDWGVLPDDWDRADPAKLQQDTEFANHTIRLLEQSHGQPFFATCGFWRPHVSWTVPQRYFDRFPLDRIELPEGYRADDLADVPPPGKWIATHRGEHRYLVENGLWKRCLQGYYASVAYMDEQVGRVLDALERGPNRDNTIVVFATDHGWHNGEKNHWSKYVLWEQACRVTFAISVPGLPSQVCPSPVSLIDLYPTLLGLCGIPRPSTHALDGSDLAFLLRGSGQERGRTVLNTYGRGNHAVCNGRFRFIRYRDGSEELYDHDHDPWEWTNLAADARWSTLKTALARTLPVTNAPNITYVSGAPKRDGNGWPE